MSKAVDGLFKTVDRQKAEIVVLKELLREHLTAPDNQKIREWEDLSKRTKAAIGKYCLEMYGEEF